VAVPNPLDLFGDAVGGVVGWAWDKVIQGIYTWFANGLLLLMEWVWNVLDTATTPRVTEAWFTNGLIRPLAGVAVGITVAMMLASAIQAGLGGRPELIIDALKEGPKSLVATALTVVVMDVMIQGGDVWPTSRGRPVAATPNRYSTGWRPRWVRRVGWQGRSSGRWRCCSG
jgi:hypothetical protein